VTLDANFHFIADELVMGFQKLLHALRSADPSVHAAQSRSVGVTEFLQFPTPADRTLIACALPETRCCPDKFGVRVANVGSA
jgi:hypothetical protein